MNDPEAALRATVLLNVHEYGAIEYGGLPVEV